MAQASDKPNVNEVAQKAKEEGKEFLENFSDTFKDKSIQAKEKVDEMKNDLEQYVHDYPYKTILIAGLAGAALGLLIKR